MPVEIKLALATLVAFAATLAHAAQDGVGNTLDGFVASPVFFTSQDSGGNTLNAILPGPFSLASTSGNGLILTTPTLLDEGEAIGEGEGSQEGEGTTEGEGTVDGEGIADGEGAADGEGTIDGEGTVDGEGAVDGEGGAEGEGESGLCEVTLSPVKDATIYNNAVDPGEAANGAGQRLFVGTTGNGAARRALISFGVANALPVDAQIVSVELRMVMDKASSANAQDIEVSRLTNDFSGGPTDPPDSGDGSGEGNGAQAVTGDATWLHISYDDSFWVAAGGDYASQVSATTPVADNGEYAWSGQGLVDDVQAWVDGTFSEFGWIFIGNESANGTAKRFHSVDSPSEEEAPRLVITYNSLEQCPRAHDADTDGDFSISLSELLRVVQFYNADRYGCDAGNLEDGFAPGSTDESCGRHDSDYREIDFRIDLSELLRMVQIFNLGSYARCANALDSEDGFCLVR